MDNFNPQRSFKGIVILLIMIIIMIVGNVFFQDKLLIFGLISTIIAFLIYCIAFAIYYYKYKQRKSNISNNRTDDNH